MTESNLVRNLNEIGKSNLPLVGGKAANLGELLKAGIPIPAGFVVTSEAYALYMKSSHIDEKIMEVLSHFPIDDPDTISAQSKEIIGLFEKSSIPNYLIKDVRLYANELSEKRPYDDMKLKTFAVRSSATIEDSKSNSLAGQFSSFLNVPNDSSALEAAIKQCFSSLYNERAIVYRKMRGIPENEISMAVVVQRMVRARVAGVLFTSNPVTKNNSQIVIEGNWGLGESVVSGMVTPDEFIVSKSDMQFISKNIHIKKKQVLVEEKEPFGTIEVETQNEKKGIPCLTDEEVLRLSSLGLKIESFFGAPQDIEWVISENLPFQDGLRIVQSRPITS